MRAYAAALLIISSVSSPALAVGTSPLGLDAAPPSNDSDTACASVFTLLSEEARASGIASDGFDSMAFTAQRAHLQVFPNDDQQRYALRVIDDADAMRQALARGSITNDTIMSAATGCNARYGASGN